MIYNQFYSNSNIQLLTKIINNELENNYNLKNINIQENLKKCMNYVKDNVSNKPPKNISNDDYLVLMNDKVYKLVIKLYQNDNSNQINKLNENIYNKKVKAESNKIQSNLFDHEVIKNYKNNENIIDYPKPSFQNNSGLSNHAEKLKKERELIYPKAEEINFSLDNDENIKTNTVDLYNDLLSSYNEQNLSLNSFENNQNHLNDNIINQLNTIESNSSMNNINELNNTFNNNTEINKLTPINKLSNIETFQNRNNDEKNNYKNEDSIYNFQNFLQKNNNEIEKDSQKLKIIQK